MVQGKFLNSGVLGSLGLCSLDSGPAGGTSKDDPQQRRYLLVPLGSADVMLYCIVHGNLGQCHLEVHG